MNANTKLPVLNISRTWRKASNSVLKIFSPQITYIIFLENELLRQNNKVLSLEVTGLKTKMNNLQHEVDSLHEEVFQLQFKNTVRKIDCDKMSNMLIKCFRI